MKQELQHRFVRLLASATDRGVLTWEKRVGNCYQSVKPSQSYHLRWLYWYAPSGITIDRQGIVISTGQLDIPFFSGTTGMAEARKLLEKIDASWTAHHSRIDEKCRLFITQNSSFSKANIMSQSSLIFLSQLLLATKNGSIRWSYNELNPNSFYTEFMNHAIVIDLLQPIDSHETPLGNLVAKVTLPGATIAFACGTDGFFTIEEILASSFPEFHHRFERTMDVYQSAIDALTKLIH